MSVPQPDIRPLVSSWMLALRAERSSPETLKTYSDGVRFYLDWCEENAVEPLLRSSLNLWIAALLDSGAAASTARVGSSPSAGSRTGSPTLTPAGRSRSTRSPA